MARTAKKNLAKVQPKGKQPAKNRSWWMVLLAFWSFLGPIIGGGVGLLAQDYLDVLKTNRQIAATYAESATESADQVETNIASLVKLLGSPTSTIPNDVKNDLRTALLALQRDTERLRIQTGVPDILFQAYAQAMADLAESVDAATGPADAKPFIEALNRFYVSKRAFEESVAQTYRPNLGLG